MNFYTIPFNNITTEQLYKIYKLRSEVFIVEQNCAYQDVDEFDLQAHHVLIISNNDLIAYARILPPNANYLQPSIGRVLVEKNYRTKNYGKQLMIYCIEQTQLLFPKQQIVISAQTYLLKFYTELGFTAIGEGYLEDNIPHIKMYL
jgi:ElaA protein